MEELAKRRCKDGADKVGEEEQSMLLDELGNNWKVDNQRLTKSFEFPDFATALAFVNKAGQAAEDLNHHPDLHLGYGRVGVEIWTHSAGGVTENDFILAARIEKARSS